MFLNGTRIAIKSFQEYVDLYLGPKDNGVPRIYERFSERQAHAPSYPHTLACSDQSTSASMRACA